jgi:hypothetical protein
VVQVDAAVDHADGDTLAVPEREHLAELRRVGVAGRHVRVHARGLRARRRLGQRVRHAVRARLVALDHAVDIDRADRVELDRPTRRVRRQCHFEIVEVLVDRLDTGTERLQLAHSRVAPALLGRHQDGDLGLACFLRLGDQRAIARAELLLVCGHRLFRWWLNRERARRRESEQGGAHR